MPAAIDVVVMPQLGESIVEGTIVRWLVKPGDAVTRGQSLAEVETDKATSEIPAPRDGRVEALLAPEGATVDVGTAVLRLAGPEPASAAPPPGRADGEPRAEVPAAERLASNRLAPNVGGPRRTSPAVRRLARAHGVDLEGLAGSGRRGRVTRDDVLGEVDRQGQAQPAVPSLPPPIARELGSPFPSVLPAQSSIDERGRLEPPSSRTVRSPRYRPEPNDRIVPFSRRREQIADHMIHSLATSAHVAAVAEVDMQRVLRAREADLDKAAAHDVRLTFMPYVVAAVAKALGEHPELNATVLERSLVLRADKNIGIAVDAPEGLVVPVVRRADELGILGLARAIEALSARAREGRLTPEDVGGGSFTISNPGRDGNLFGISIIRQPEVAILRLGTILKRPVVREVEGEDVIAVRPMMYLALSYDHRVIDGRKGNSFLSRLVSLLSSTAPAL